MNKTHEIDRLSIKMNGQLSREFLQYIREETKRIILKYFDRHFPSEKILIIKRIELDLGTLTNGKHFSQEFNIRLSYLLDTELMKFFQDTNNHALIESNIAISALENFIYYLKTGFSKSEGITLAILFEELLKDNLNHLKKIVESTEESEAQYKRLLYQIPFSLLERYWKKTYPIQYVQVLRVNRQVLKDIELRIKESNTLSLIKEALRQTTFQFLIGQVPKNDVELVYLLFLRNETRNFEDILPQRSFNLFEELYQDRLPIKNLSKASSDRELLNSILFYVETGRFEKAASDVLLSVQKLSKHDISKLVTRLLPVTTRFKAKIKRLFRTFTLKQIEWFLLELRYSAPKSLTMRVDKIIYMRKIIISTFSLDILTLGQLVISEYLASARQDEVEDLYVLDELLKLIAAKKGNSEKVIASELTTKLNTSFYQEAISIKKQLNRIQTISDDLSHDEKSVTDVLQIYLQYLRTGVWNLARITPQEILKQLLDSSDDNLTKQLAQLNNYQAIWLRLIYQNPVDLIRIIVDKVFAGDASLVILNSFLEKEIVTSDRVLSQRRILESFIAIKNEIEESSEDQFLILFEQRINELFDWNDRDEVLIHDKLYSKEKEEIIQQRELSEIYIVSFIHFIKYNRHIYLQVEDDGFILSLDKILKNWLNEFIGHLRKEPDVNRLITTIFDRLDDADVNRYFLLLLPEYRDRFHSIYDLLIFGHKLDKNNLLASWFSVHVHNDTLFDNQQLVDLILKEIGLSQEKPFDLLSFQSSLALDDISDTDDTTKNLFFRKFLRLGIDSADLYEFNVFDLIKEVILSGKFPQWSQIHSRHDFLMLLNEVADSEPVLLDHLFNDLLKNDIAIKNLLFSIQYDGFLSVVEKLGTKPVIKIKQVVEELVSAHLDLGDEDAIRIYFFSKYISEIYAVNNATVDELTNSVLQLVPSDFGLSGKDYLAIIKVDASIIVNNYVRGLRTGLTLKEDNNEIDTDVDLLLDLILKKEIPWWAAEQIDKRAELKNNSIEILILDSLLKQPMKVLSKIKNNRQKDRIYDLIIASLSSGQFIQILQAITPKYASKIISYDRLLTHWSASLDRNGWRVFVLNYFAELGTSPFDVRLFITSSLSYISNSVSLNLSQLAHELTNELIKRPLPGDEVFFKIFSVWDVPRKVTNEEDDQYLKECLEAFTYYLETGSFSERMSIALIDETKLIQYIKDHATKANTGLRTLITDALRNDTVLLRILNDEDEEFLIFLVDILFEANTQKLYRYEALSIIFIRDQGPFLSNKVLARLFYKTVLESLSDFRYTNSSEAELIVKYILKVNEDFNLLVDLREVDLIKYNFDSEIIDKLLAFSAKKEQTREFNTISFIKEDEFESGIVYYLKTGLLPIHILDGINAKAEFVKELQSQLTKGNKGLENSILTILKQDSVRVRLIRTESSSLLSLLSGVLYPKIKQILEFYKQSLFQFFHRQGIMGSDLVLLNQLYYQSLFDSYFVSKYTTATGEQLITYFVNLILDEVESMIDLEFDGLQDYGFVQEVIDQFHRSKNAVIGRTEKLKIEKASSVFSSDDFLIYVDQYLRSGLLPDRATTGIANLLELKRHIQQQVKIGNTLLRKLVSKVIREEDVRMRLVHGESNEFSWLLLSILYPTSNQRLKILRHNVIQIIMEQNPSVTEVALSRVFLQSSFEAILDNEHIVIEELIFSFIKNSIHVLGVTIDLKSESLQSYGFNDRLQRMLFYYLDKALFQNVDKSVTLNISAPIESLDSVSQSQSFKNALEHYLRTGLLSVNYATRLISLAQLTYLLKQLTIKGDKELFTKIVTLLREQKVRLRVIDEEHEDFVFLLLRVIYPEANQRLNILKTNAIRLFQDQHPSLSERALNKLFFEHAFEVLLNRNDERIAVEYLIITFIRNVFNSLDSAISLDVTLLKRYGFTSSVSVVIINSLYDDAFVSDIKLSSEVEQDVFADIDLDWNVKQNIDLLIFLVLHEELPWWARKWKSFNYPNSDINFLIDQLTLPLFANYTKEIVVAIHKTGVEHRIYQRLLSLLSEVQFEQVIVSLAASFGHFINGFTSLIIAWRNSIQRITWRSFILNYLHHDRSFNAVKFIESSLSYLSGSLRIDEDQLRDELRMLAKQELKLGELSYAPFPDLLESKNTVNNSSHEIVEPVILFACSLETALTYYLKNGSLPPGVLPSIKSYDAFVNVLSKQLYLGVEAISNVIVDALLDERIRARMISKEQPSFLFIMLRAVYPNQERQLKIYKSTSTQFFSGQLSSFELQSFDELFFQTMFEPMGKDNYSTLTAEKLITSFIIKAGEVFNLNKGFYSAVLLRYGFNQDIINELIKSGTRFLKEDRSLSSRLLSDDQLDHRVLVKNSGLVIVAPYLTRYFDLLSMTENSMFKSEEDAVRAVHLLQYVATGFASAPEHELVLNKILCGVKLSTPVPIELTLTEKEKEVTNQMLNGVLQNWEKLRNSSVQALQEGFMIREGAIQEKEDVWQLKVEKKTLDILMENLPWSFGTIKLPWMEKILNVEWL